MIAYKLFKLRADGSLGSLFINSKVKLEENKWLAADCYPTKNFKVRKGWHCVPRKFAPHLSKTGRVWRKVEIKNIKELIKPKNQGGRWFLAGKMRILK